MLPGTQVALEDRSSDDNVVIDVAYHSLWIERMAKGKRPYPWSEMHACQIFDGIDAYLCAHNFNRAKWL